MGGAGGLHFKWSQDLGSPVAAVHLIGKGTDIVKVPHVYLHQDVDSNTPNILALRDQHEVIYVGRNPSGDFFAISNTAVTEREMGIELWGELLEGVKKGESPTSLSMSKDLALPQNIRNEESMRFDKAVALLEKDEEKHSMRLGYEWVDLTPDGLPMPKGSLSPASLCKPGVQGYPSCLRGFHVLRKNDHDHQYQHLPYPYGPEGLPLSLPAPPKPESKWGYLIGVLGGLGGLMTPIILTLIRRIRGGKLEEGTIRAVSDKKKEGTKATRGKGRKKNHLRLGKMRIFTHLVLGKGSGGTVVYKGLWDRREVAIKRLLKDSDDTEETDKEGQRASKEIELLISSDHLPNIVRYYGQEEDSDFMYLALELCRTTLHEYVTTASFSQRTGATIIGSNISDAELIRQAHGVVSGVYQLHSLNVVHRDLKPRNILLDAKGEPKIADMGLGKKLAKHRSSFDSRVCGSVGWQPAEMIGIRSRVRPIPTGSPRRFEEKKEAPPVVSGRLTKAVDIFSAGCIVYYVLTRGKHPFGTEPEREYKIIHNKPDLSGLDHMPLAQELVRAMLAREPKYRISARDAVNHPLFWDDGKSLGFLQDVSDRVVKVNSFALCAMMETNANDVVGLQWDKKLHHSLLADLGRYRSYNFTSVCDCLRVIRNKKNHYLELPKVAKAQLGSLPNGFHKYFATRFPRLLIHSYITIGSFYVSRREEDSDRIDFETFETYYKDLSERRLQHFCEMNRRRPCRGWWPRADIWAM